MSDAIKHECGIAFLRLKKDLGFYLEKYGTAFYGLHKMQLLMEKQHNRGQDGAGLANIKLNVAPGERYISRARSVKPNPIQDLFEQVFERFQTIERKSPEKLKDVDFLKRNAGFTGEVFLGHLRYGTFGQNAIENCHPFLRQNNWMTKNLVLAGNFNLTNVDELFDSLVALGQHPKEMSDTVTVLERIGHFLDEENERIYNEYKQLGYDKSQISNHIRDKMDIGRVLERAAKKWDGGYVMAGLLGHGAAFVLRDPSGIRPAFYFNGMLEEKPVLSQKLIKKCVFERIYFSRGSDKDIYNERKMLGHLVAPQIVQAIGGEIDRSVFSYIPNTAEVSFYGMIKAVEGLHNLEKAERILALGNDASKEAISEILEARTRIEKIAIKDAKLRTFITQDSERDDLVTHVYDITYGSINRGQDNLVVIDDSIVRGTTLKKSILRMLDRLEPKSIVVVSSAPQIRYPDCYGIDMAKLGDFVAFNAAISLLRERNMENLIEEVYQSCKQQLSLPKEEVTNAVKRIYAPFSDEEISDQIAELLKPSELKANLKIVFQKIENVHKACPGHLGDWYFSGDYPTPGGNKVVNKAFINWVEHRDERAY